MRTLCDVLVQGPSPPTMSHMTLCRCFQGLEIFYLFCGLGVLRNYFKEWTSRDALFNAVEVSQFFTLILTS